MRRPYFAGPHAVRLALLDTISTALAIAVALLVRSGFRAYLVSAAEIAVMAPLVIVSRFAILAVFEHYAVVPTAWLVKDVVSLAYHNLIVSVLLIALRFLSPTDVLKLPLSVIFMEYVLSTFLVFLVRAYYASRSLSGFNASPRYRPRVLLWGEVREIVSLRTINQIAKRGDVRLVGILTANPLYWETNVDGLRVFGDESRIPDILYSDDSVSAVCVVTPAAESLVRMTALCDAVDRHGMDLLVVAEGVARPITRGDLLRSVAGAIDKEYSP